MYRTILVKNGEYKKTLHRCKTRETAFINFRRIKETNEVVFPRKFVNSHAILPAKYGIYVIKDYEEGDTFRYVRDRFGKVKTEPQFGDWIVLDDANYDIEETFWMFGHDPKHDRVTIHEVLDTMLDGSPSDLKQVIVVHNKLVMHSQSTFDMIICKCKKDAQRLHHALYDIIKEKRIKGFIFMGTARPATVPIMYEIIQEETDWPIQKIRRTSTRP